MNEHIVLVLAIIGLISILCQWFAWWVKLPSILFLLLVGIFLGPVFGWLKPDDIFGHLLFPFISLSVAVILFEGSLTLKFDEIKGVQRVVQYMVSIGMLVTWIVVSLVTRVFLGFPWELAFLFGAIMVVTGPTVIVPMLRTVRPNAAISNILRWEGIIIDPIGALLAVLVFEFVISAHSGGFALGHTFWIFGKIVFIGLFLGGLGGYIIGSLLRKHILPEYLHNVASLTAALGVFAFSNAIQEESGLLSVTVMGVWLANMKNVHVDDILDFKESLSVLLISVLFIILAARIEFAQFELLGISAVAVFLVMQFIARPLKVLVSTWNSELKLQEKMLLAWIAPRGIVAAAISALFAIRLQENFDQASLLVPLTFSVIIGTVVLQSATAGPLARMLKVAEPEPKGFLIIGANQVARVVAKSLEEKGFRALLTDSNWDNIRTARMEGLRTFFGSPVSEHADRNLDLVGIGRLFGLSHHAERNALAALRYRTEFGKNNVYSIQSAYEASSTEKHKIATIHRGDILFGDSVSYSSLAKLVNQGGEIKSTKITDSFSFDDLKALLSKEAVLMFALDRKNNLHIFSHDSHFQPEVGWTIISLVPKSEESKNGH